MRPTAIYVIASVFILLCAGSASAWYDGYGYRIPLNIDNTGGSALADHQLNVSLDGFCADSIRVVNETAGTAIPHWCENVTGDDCYEVWFNVTNIPAGVWTNDTYYIYYHKYDAACASNFDDTFTKSYNTSGLVLELHMDDGNPAFLEVVPIAVDSSGNGNNGTLTDMDTTGSGLSGWQGVDGGQWDGQANTTFSTGTHLRFDGTNDYVDCGNDTSLDITGAITVCGWIKADTQTGTSVFMSKMRNGADTRSWAIYSSGTSENAQIIVTQAGVYPANCKAYTTSVSVFDDVWHHVSFTFTSNTLKVYVDGDEDTAVTKDVDNAVSSLYSSVEDVHIGAFANPSNFLDGDIDEVRIYNRVLSGDEIYRQYVRSKYATTHPSTSLGARETNGYPVIELLSQTPTDLYQNSTGFFNQTWGIHHANPLNEDAITMIYRNIYDGEPRHSLRMPGNDRATDGWRGANRNETGANRLVMEDVAAVFGGNYYNWSAGDIEHNVRMHLDNVNSTYTIVQFNDSVQMTTFPASWYLDRSEMIDAAKTEMGIYKHYSRLVKIYDNEMMLMSDENYTMSIWIDTVDNGVSLAYPLSVWWANESFDPAGGVAIADSPYATQIGAITDTDWETRESFPHSNDYMRFSVYAGPGMEVQPTSTGYLYFEYDYPQKFIMNCTDVTTSTNVSFADTGVMWTSAVGGSVYTPLAYTPNMFLTFHVANQTFQSQLWAMESTATNLSSSYLEETVIQQSSFAPGNAIFNHFAFMGFNDTTMDCVYRGTVSPTLLTCGDPDGGTVSGNLTLCYSDGTHVAVINDTFGSSTSAEFIFDFNTAPYYSTTDLYTLKLVCTDDENDVSVSWLPTDFALSPLATTGVLYNGKATSPRVLFWGINDIHALYISVANTSRMSYAGGIYTMYQAFHQGQYGDDFDFSESVRIESRNATTTPFYRFTGDNTFDYATITSWNTSSGAPSPITDTYRTYMYSDEYYSSADITNSDISNLGAGEEPYAGIYLQHAEGTLIDNNILTNNGEGIILKNGGNITVSNNTLDNPSAHTISIYDVWGNVTVRDNVINSSVETAGIVMWNAGADNLLDNNTITDIVQTGFHFSYMSDTIVSDNTINGAQRGVALARNCQNFTIVENDIDVVEDALGNPAWGFDIMSGTHNISDNVLSVTDGYGFSIMNYYTDIPCINSVMENNRVSTTSGTHPDAGTFADYVFDYGTTGNTIRDPADTSNTVSILGADDVTIENTDNAVFTHAGNNHAVISNPGITQLVDDIGVYTVAQTSMTITPSTGTMDFYDFVWDEETSFVLDASDPAAYVEMGATRSDWVYTGMWLDVGGEFYDAYTAGSTGYVAYNYTGGFAVSPLVFSIHERVLEGWQALGEDSASSYSDLVMIIGICVMIVVVGGIIIGLRSFAGDISPEILIIVAIAIGLGLLILVTMIEVVPSVMQPMENITMEGL